MKNKTFFWILVLVLFLLPVTPPAFCSYPGSEEAVVRAVARVEPSVVNIKALIRNPSSGAVREGAGSGIVISRNGWIITNAHVTRNASKIFVTLNDGRTFTVTEWRAHSTEDIAVMKIQADNLPEAPIGNSNDLKKGQIAIAIGNPWKFSSTVTVGCISATGRHLGTRRVNLSDMIQTDAAINPGNSGGALVNSRGEIVGINTVIYTGAADNKVQGLGFAIPVNRAMIVARELMNRKEAGSVKPWLGVTIQDISPDMGLSVRHGILITGFPPNSPARNAGLQVGDIIASIDNSPVTGVETLGRLLNGYKPGDTVTIVLVRGGRHYRVKVQLEGMNQ